MSKISVYNQAGESIGQQELNPKIFELPARNALIHQVATAMQANRRNTVASTKTRGEVRGGGKKPWQQKGTGRARAGSIRSPLWRGGGIMFGPRSNRAFGRKVNKKAGRLGILTLLSERARESRILVLDTLTVESGKTRDLGKTLGALAAKIENFGRQVLLVVPGRDENLFRAARNLPRVRLAMARDLNLLEILTADQVVILKDALPVLESVYLRNTN